jgi:hypothetical protein
MPKQNKVQKKKSVMIMLPHCVPFSFLSVPMTMLPLATGGTHA